MPLSVQYKGVDTSGIIIGSDDRLQINQIERSKQEDIIRIFYGRIVSIETSSGIQDIRVILDNGKPHEIRTGNNSIYDVFKIA